MDILNGSWLSDDVKLIEDEDNSWVDDIGDAFTLEGSNDEYPILVWEKI